MVLHALFHQILQRKMQQRMSKRDDQGVLNRRRLVHDWLTQYFSQYAGANIALMEPSSDIGMSLHTVTSEAYSDSGGSSPVMHSLFSGVVPSRQSSEEVTGKRGRPESDGASATADPLAAHALKRAHSQPLWNPRHLYGMEPAPQQLHSRCPRCCYEFVVDPHYALFPHGGAQVAPRANLPQVDAPSWGMPMSSSDGGASLQHQFAPDRQHGTYDAEVIAQSLDEEFVTEYIC
jgi:hypothetical protein